MKREELNKQSEKMENMYDFVKNAISTWDEEKKENILIHLVCLWAVAAKAEDQGGIRHPLVQRIREMLRLHGLKTSEEIRNLKKMKGE